MRGVYVPKIKCPIELAVEKADRMKKINPNYVEDCMKSDYKRPSVPNGDYLKALPNWYIDYFIDLYYQMGLGSRE